ncbi:velvet factor-domain-containing protein [Annulohypoxylon truncatum]|uniref:velvet factor-domain-containing protein n=1 Tax=Annulohypoxylon truncatum TaxID=327061 RepID=UPI002008A343|nr:velvet factor-domain-containing protein [Annulohypoxylon truncatum]KAI1210407.1 velvet factor-domain-containing protein [Annulohypoxylon truncatum]
MANAMAPQAESRMYVREHRITKGGRHLWYQLEVLQQPERARACGSGPKSSADRRPVDPPPVVTLRVFEGEHFEGARDITFDYNVDFFCYASLEHARPMAHGRVQTPAATSPPVLTGFPVSGCCYLDRPDPAGYFLFPDLSVRHEGRYRLVFSLYELIKEEQDQDRDAPPQDHEDGMSDLNAGNANHRMDLRSTDFIVYSAKKFPGLTESTSLSRTVAEQGCRVRIRRDVRMRRRDTKANAASEYDNNAEDEYARRRNRTQTPETYRARSMSNSSMDRASYVPDQRRPSNAEYGPPPPPLYQNGGPQPSTMLNFGHGGNAGFAQPYGPAPTSGQSTPVSPAAPMFPQSNNFPPPPPSPSYAPPGYPHYDSASDQEMRRRSSASYSTISNNPPAPYSLSRAPPRPPTASSMGPIPSLSSLIPIASPKMSPSHYSDRSCSISALSRPTYPQPEPRSMKRSIDELTSSTQQGRNVNGDRPSIDYPGVPFYRRADGSERTANFPDPI